jgi:hypothetical protein
VNVNSVRRGALALAGAAALGVGLLSAPAQADPSEHRSLVGVGSDTTQDVVQGLSDWILDGDGTPAELQIASYHATNPVTQQVGDIIDTRPASWPAACEIVRPNGSSRGIDALNADIAADTNCVDFARSSRGPATTGPNLTFIPFATDAVTWAVRGDSPLADEELTLAQLQAVYNCQTTTIDGVQVTPLLPQQGSGTRSFWVTELGLNESALPACVTDRNNTVQEHNGNALVNPGDIMPYSVAQYLAQSNGAPGVIDRRGDAELRPIGTSQPVLADGTLNPAFQINRPVYNVVESARLGEGELATSFVGPNSEVCFAGDVIEEYGFATSDDCGDTSLTGNR